MTDRPSSSQGATEPSEEQKRAEEEKARTARYTKLSFDDGNIILQAETASFCVHRGILSLHSEVFRDMLMVGNAASEETRGGITVLRLSDPDADVYELLRAMYLPEHIYRPIPMAMGLCLTLLKMSTKYVVDFVRQEVINRLLMRYPRTLPEYMNRARTMMRAGIPKEEINEGSVHILALEAALRLDVPEILPTLFLECCQMDLDDILNGVNIIMPNMPNNVVLQFIPSTLKAVLRGRQELLDLRRRWICKMIPKLSNSWPGAHCRDGRDALPRLLLSQSTVAAFDIFSSGLGDVSEGFCQTCEDGIKADQAAINEQVWRRLPKCFGLKWELSAVAAPE
ncbi:hypothetical protein FA95DRAFT_1559491 [Auriscalpium vulgare]|uniref:Uncharacterized protein n=1 Tax=Auriscalpium vulgare TaxID=40419 RepID=A0ACB8RTG1_9AGAM|nr:hypothetical protein FA95DRAFT_1559491 [Auriscalpium vulgare]